jgi:putative transposase
MCYGEEFTGRLLDHWAYLNGVEIDFSRPGKPTDNAFIEAFNARLRAEYLNASWFLSLADARARIEEWRCHYNEERPTRCSGTWPQGPSPTKFNQPENLPRPRTKVGVRTKEVNSLTKLGTSSGAKVRCKRRQPRPN